MNSKRISTLELPKLSIYSLNKSYLKITQKAGALENSLTPRYIFLKSSEGVWILNEAALLKPFNTLLKYIVKNQFVLMFGFSTFEASYRILSTFSLCTLYLFL